MTALRTVTSLLAAAIVLLALPMAAGAEYYVPPGNSAATQYTEALPTAGGDRNASKGTSKAGQRSPAKVLGSRNARRLEEQGPTGRAAAKLAAETSPAAEAPGAGSGSGKVAPAGRGGVLSGGGSRQAGGTAPGDASQQAGKLDRQVAAEEPGGGPSGGSGLGEILSQATGSSSSGEMGLLLPIVILAAIAWSVAFGLRQRKRPTT